MVRYNIKTQNLILIKLTFDFTFYLCVFSTNTSSASFRSFPFHDNVHLQITATLLLNSLPRTFTQSFDFSTQLFSPFSIFFDTGVKLTISVLIFHKHDSDGLGYLKHSPIISFVMHRRILTTRDYFSLITYFQTEQSLSANTSQRHFLNAGLKHKVSQ